MKLYVSDIVESYKYTIIGHLGNTGTVDLLLHIVQCWCACAVDKGNCDLSIVIYCSGILYKYYSSLGFLPINTQ